MDYKTEKQRIIFESLEEEIDEWMHVKGKHHQYYDTLGSPIRNPLHIHINYIDSDTYNIVSINGNLLRNPFSEYRQNCELNTMTKFGTLKQSLSSYMKNSEVPFEFTKKDFSEILHIDLDDSIRGTLTGYNAKLAQGFSMDKQDINFEPWNILSPELYFDAPKERGIDVGNLNAIVKYISRELKSRNKNIDEVRCGLNICFEDTYMANSEKSKIYLSTVLFKLILESTFLMETNYLHGAYGSIYTKSLNTMLNEKNIEKLIQTVDRETNELRKAKIENSGNMPVLLGPDAAAALMHESFAHLLSAQYIDRKKSTVYAKSKNEKVMPSQISIWNDPTIGLSDTENPLSWGSYGYDLEGVKTKKQLLIDRGVLMDFLHSRSTAAKRNILPCGNMRGKLTMTDKGALPPEPRISNLIVAIDKDSTVDLGSLKKLAFQEAKKQGKNYSLFCDTTEGYTTIEDGIIVLNPTRSYRLHKSGQERVIVDDLVIGNSHSVLTEDEILAYGNDYAISQGHCGSTSGDIPTAQKSPSFLLKRVAVNRDPLRRKELPPLIEHKE